MNERSDAEQEVAAREVQSKLERVLGVSGITTSISHAGGQPFLKLQVGRRSPYYDHAIHTVQLELPDDHLFKGRLGLLTKTPNDFPSSLEADCLLTLLTRATRKVVQGSQSESYSVPYVPFQNGEDHKLTQPASHLIVGRRGVGKSTLISRAIDLLDDGKNIAVVVDMQPYSDLAGDSLLREVLHDVVAALLAKGRQLTATKVVEDELAELQHFSGLVSDASTATSLPAQLRRVLSRITNATKGGIFVFLDDFHIVTLGEQPTLLQHLHGALKGANGWLKVAGLGSLLNSYDPIKRHGLQVPGDAQRISLDLTLENPKAAESHLESILENFVKAVGLPQLASALPQAPFRRLVWANAGVPRDFLQMFARSLELARKGVRSTVALTDVNVAIGEFGQPKIDQLQADARNEKGMLEEVISFLGRYCLDGKKTNAFLVRSDKSEERRFIQVLSDLRLVHLIHQSITPDRAGERYEAFIIDYALFTGFRRRREIQEMLPVQGNQFKASVLRKLPKLPAGFATDSRSSASATSSVPPARRNAPKRRSGPTLKRPRVPPASKRS